MEAKQMAYKFSKDELEAMLKGYLRAAIEAGTWGRKVVSSFLQKAEIINQALIFQEEMK